MTSNHYTIGHLVVRLIKTETFPDSFRNTVLHMVWKDRGGAEVLKNSRFVHMKTIFPRACEAVIVHKMREKILKSSSIYQVGGQTGHSLDESIFAYRTNYRIILFLVTNVINYVILENTLGIM